MSSFAITESQFYKDVKRSQEYIFEIEELLDSIEGLLLNGRRFDAYMLSLKYVEKLEFLVNRGRLMPTATGYKDSLDAVKDIVVKSSGSCAKYLNDNIFYLRIPSLLPKKEMGNPSYIRATVKYVLEDFFKKNERVIIDEKVVIVIKHNYSKDRDSREYRDHDNIEVKSLIDLLALYVLVDDSPDRCDHYYLSSVANKDNTEVYIVPISVFDNGFLQSIRG